MAALRHLARGLALRCPHCGRGRIFATFFRARAACAECGRVFESDSGDWIGGAEITMLLALPVGVLAFVALNAVADLSAAAEVAAVVAVAGVVLAVGYRHVKGFWMGLVRAWEGPDPQPAAVTDPEWFREHWERELER